MTLSQNRQLHTQKYHSKFCKERLSADLNTWSAASMNESQNSQGRLLELDVEMVKRISTKSIHKSLLSECCNLEIYEHWKSPLDQMVQKMNVLGKRDKTAKKVKCKTLWLLVCGWGSTASRPRHQYWEALYFLPISTRKFLELIWSTLEGWKAESTLELPSGFEHGTP